MAETSETRQDEHRIEKAQGVVVRNGADKTCSVVIDRLVRHRLYGKFLRSQTRLAVHDPENQAQVGDRVEITPCRPMSKTKRWRLLSIIKRAELPQH
jgi:small subunit ribosomal protein S17